MFNIIDNLITERHRLIVEECDVIRVLRTINAQHKSVPEMKVGSCGWVDDPSKWFIFFTTTRAKWDKLVKELEIVRVWNHDEIPNNAIGVVYSTD